MELCFEDLQKIIQLKPKCFGRQRFSAVNSVEFYISCQLFKEIVECVQYLHESNPPIIHRDLKPQNILINDKSKSGKFVKLCDFGLAKEIEYTSMSHTERVGTFGYMAPEVFLRINGKIHYTTKADIYSLGQIMLKLFDYEIEL